jgi:hypothetical protein
MLATQGWLRFTTSIGVLQRIVPRGGGEEERGRPSKEIANGAMEEEEDMFA